jgi:dTMP kinase
MLIVIEGIDGSGKQTQTEMLISKIEKIKPVRKISFPNYESNTSALVKMYLGGEFGENAFDVNAYAASCFYAADRIGSYLSDWKKDLDKGSVVISDRYTTSNAVHQAGKLEGREREEYLNWLFDFEYKLMGLPKPDFVFFLNMPPEYGRILMKDRSNKITGEAALDIHESNEEFLQKSYDNALDVAKKCGWTVVDCVKDGIIRTIEDINNEIYAMVNDKL